MTSPTAARIRSHAALVIPLMAIGTVVAERRAGISWREAGTYAEAMEVAFRIVHELGHTLAPSSVHALSRLPRSLVKALFWATSRTRMLRDLGAFGSAEARMLIDLMTTAAPGKTAALLAIRP
jgi:2-dehydropantoate 2-reductase